MGNQSKITTVIYNELPNKLVSYRLLDDIHSKIKPTLSSISRKIDKPLILYGAGNLGKMAKTYFDKLNIQFLFVVDKTPETYSQDPFWKNTKIIKSLDVPCQLRNSSMIVICVVTSSFSEIENSLKKQGWNDIIPFYDITLAYQDKHPLNNGWCTGLLDNRDIESMNYVMSHLDDNISRAHYLQFIAWHACREEWIFKHAPISNNNRYFIPEIVSILTNNETFVDIGSHHGEVITKFINIVKNKFNCIYAFEPDKENVDTFHKNMIDNTYLIQTALGEKDEKKKFYSELGYSSQLSDLSDNVIDVTKLDNYKLSPTLIKIHTEGNEGDIIKGGLETITKNRPIIVTTCYHNRNGLWKIFALLISSLTNYIYYFRLHSWCGTGAVIYAIPKERVIK